MGKEAIIKTFHHDNKVIAILFDTKKIKSTDFISDPNDFFQLGFGFINDDITLSSHIHRKVNRNINQTSEFIFVIDGAMTINILDPNACYIDSANLLNGYGFLQLYGGHEISISAGTSYFEIKQGPYLGQAFDKHILTDE